MSKAIIKELEAFKDVDGFIAAGAFTANGEMLADVSTSDIKLAELGSLANDVLLKAQKSTDIMGVGRGNLIHIIAPKANIIARCLNENTDYADNQPGRAHIHLVLVLGAEANIAMGKLRVDSVIAKIAEIIR